MDDLQFICEHHNIMRKMVKSDCKWVESIRLVLKLIVYLITFFLLKRGLSEMSFRLVLVA